MNSLKLPLFLLTTFLFTPAFGVKPVEERLRLNPNSGYTIGEHETTEDHLKNLIATKIEALENAPHLRDNLFLEMGDAYHWLGHIEEERKNWKRALHYFHYSFVCYQMSRHKISPRINYHETADHAEKHILMIHHNSSLIEFFREMQNATKAHLPNSYKAYLLTLQDQFGKEVLKQVRLVRNPCAGGLRVLIDRD